MCSQHAGSSKSMHLSKTDASEPGNNLLPSQLCVLCPKLLQSQVQGVFSLSCKLSISSPGGLWEQQAYLTFWVKTELSFSSTIKNSVWHFVIGLGGRRQYVLPKWSKVDIQNPFSSLGRTQSKCRSWNSPSVKATSHKNHGDLFFFSPYLSKMAFPNQEPGM